MNIIFKQGYNCIISTRHYVPYSIVHKLKGTLHVEPTKKTIEIGRNKHILDHYGQYINHSFNPTCMINDGHLVALKRIFPGDEITFDYNKNESCMIECFRDKNTGLWVKGRMQS